MRNFVNTSVCRSLIRADLVPASSFTTKIITLDTFRGNDTKSYPLAELEVWKVFNINLN